MMTDDQQDKIDRLILRPPGSSPPGPSDDPTVELALRETQFAVDAIELAEDRALKARLQQLETKLKAGNSSGQATVIPIGKRRPSLRLFAYAATVLLLLAVGWWLVGPGTAGPANADLQLAMASFEPYDNLNPNLTRGADDGNTEVAAYVAYEAEDFAAAERLFKTLPTDPITSFYLAQSQLAQEKFGEARTLFTELAVLPEFMLARESAYYAALAQLALGDREGARAALTTIADQQDHPSRREALTLLGKL